MRDGGSVRLLLQPLGAELLLKHMKTLSVPIDVGLTCHIFKCSLRSRPLVAPFNFCANVIRRTGGDFLPPACGRVLEYSY